MSTLNIYSKEQADSLLDAKANSADVYTKTQVDTALVDKADASNVYTKTQTDTLLRAKQDNLISGTSIKTLNGNSLLGSGDITVGGSSDISVIKVIDFGWGTAFTTYHSEFDNTKVGIAYELDDDDDEYVDTIRRISFTFISTNGVKHVESLSASNLNSGLTVAEMTAALSTSSINESIASGTYVIQLYTTINRRVNNAYIVINAVLPVIGKQYTADLSGYCVSIDQKIIM